MSWPGQPGPALTGPGRPGPALTGPGQPGPARASKKRLSGLAQPGLGWPGPAHAGQIYFSWCFHWPGQAQSSPGQLRPVYTKLLTIADQSRPARASPGHKVKFFKDTDINQTRSGLCWMWLATSKKFYSILGQFWNVVW